MSDISKINPDGTEYNLKDATARTNIGNLASLHTTAKNDAVSAINEVKDEQANKADMDIVADAFSAAETYAVGDYCTYEGGLYKFKTAHEGAWDAADVDQIQIAGELSELNNTITSVEETIERVNAHTIDDDFIDISSYIYNSGTYNDYTTPSDGYVVFKYSANFESGLLIKTDAGNHITMATTKELVQSIFMKKGMQFCFGSAPTMARFYSFV